MSIEPGVFLVPIITSASLNNQHESIKETVLQAQRNIVSFAKTYGYEKYIESSFIRKVEIYDTQEAFKRQLMNQFCANQEIELPHTFSAILEDEILMSVSKAEYARIYPIEGCDLLGFERLLTHEIAHSLHIRILDGEEHKMGPVWFFEGFATYVSKQFLKYQYEDTIMWDIMENDKEASYAKYACLFRYLVSHIALNDLILNAHKKDFVPYLKSKMK